ncbi:MAG: hypothetical protein Pg6C_00520 [Treponemataceae bacterium]|nr:MAG: hypothetical protein Pg6C_00520 [Treponemataceae bacterium]
MKVETAINRIMNHAGWGTSYKIMKLESLGSKYGTGSREHAKVESVLFTLPEYVKYREKVRASVLLMMAGRLPAETALAQPGRPAKAPAPGAGKSNHE